MSRPSTDTGRPRAAHPGHARNPSGAMFLRDPDRRLVAGVTAGLGNRIGVDPLVVRIALVILTLAGGAGLVLYGLARLLSREPGPDEDVVIRDFDRRQAVAVGLMTLGLMLGLRSLGIWLSDALVWPALVAGAVSATIWMRSGPDGGDGGAQRFFDLSPTRVVVASLVLFAGAVAFWVVVGSPLDVVIPLAGIVIGGTLLASPLLTSLWRRLEAERAETARRAAREEVAAHLHDSVLQTLTLIQRTDDPRRATTLARTQERELRAWLYGDRDLRGGGARDLEAAVDDLVTDVEADHELDVDAVVVGILADVDADRHVTALLAAVREALVNVARHAEVTTASLYLEVEDRRVTAFVRDRGVGFDPTVVPEDRHGLRDSIHARLRRHDGGAVVHTDPGHGTEVEAWVPLDANAATTATAASANGPSAPADAAPPNPSSSPGDPSSFGDATRAATPTSPPGSAAPSSPGSSTDARSSADATAPGVAPPSDSPAATDRTSHPTSDPAATPLPHKDPA